MERSLSAWIVSKVHIDLMVTAGLEFGSHGPLVWWHEAAQKRYELTDRDAVGRMLWAENLASVACRYPNDEDGERPGPLDFRDSDVETYRFERVPLVFPDGAGAVAHNLACYEYQSCEHDGWVTSQAYAYCQALRGVLLYRLPGYNDAPWGFEDRDYFRTVKV
jgi:hypothetical protein